MNPRRFFRTASLSTLTAVTAGTLLLGAGAASASPNVVSGTVHTKGGDIACTVHYTTKKTRDDAWGGRWSTTATLSHCNRPIRDGMRLKIGNDDWYGILSLDPQARIVHNTAVFDNRAIGKDDYFYVDDMTINIKLP